MGVLVCGGATLSCSFGATQSMLSLLPVSKVISGVMVMATVADYVPLLNVPPFGMCSCPQNPMVAAATTAAMGVLTPVSCVPVLTTPWAPGSSKVLIGKKPALDNDCKLTCMWGGVIQVENPGQSKVLD